jgi:hypothetical protein
MVSYQPKLTGLASKKKQATCIDFSLNELANPLKFAENFTTDSYV